MRVQLATVQGAVLPNPYGGKQRQVQVDLNTAALQGRVALPLVFFTTPHPQLIPL